MYPLQWQLLLEVQLLASHFDFHYYFFYLASYLDKAKQKRCVHQQKQVLMKESLLLSLCVLTAAIRAVKTLLTSSHLGRCLSGERLFVRLTNKS